MPYAIPPWVGPNAALGYGELAGGAQRAALSAQLERERMSQQAAQSALETQQRSQQLAQENQARQNELNYNHIVDQQKLAIEQAYKDQTLGLQKQDAELAQKEFQLKTDQAAKHFAANQSFQKAILPKDQGGEGLSTTQAALKYIAPFMTGTEVGRLAAVPQDFKPGATMPIPNASNEQLVQVGPQRWEKSATIPPSITNAPPAIAVAGEDGEPLGHWVQVPGEKPRWQPAQKGTGIDLMQAVKQRQKELSGGTTERKAQGGYKIGTVYKGGLRYIGGDPKDENSWENVSPSEPEHSGPPGNETTYMMTGRTNK